MDLAEDKTVGLTGDDRDECAKATGADLQVDGESERAEHGKVDKDIVGSAQPEQEMSTEEKMGEQLDGALSTSLLPKKDTELESEPLGDGVDAMRVASIARPLNQKERRILTPKTSHEEAPDRKTAKVESASTAISETRTLGEPGSSTGKADLGCDNDLTKRLQDLSDKRDFAGADALKKKMETQAASAKVTDSLSACTEQQHLDERTKAEIQELVGKRDYKGAAAVQAAAMTRATGTPITEQLILEQHEALKAECEAKLQGFLKKSDFTEAAALDENLATLAAGLKKFRANNDLAGARKLLTEALQTPWGKSSATETLITVELIQEQHKSFKDECEAKLQGFVQRSEFDEAATLDEHLKTLSAKMATFLSGKDLAGARKLLAEAHQTTWGKSSVTSPTAGSQNEKTALQIRARSAAVVARSAATTAYTLLKDKRSMLQQEITGRNFQGLAEIDRQIKEMEAEYSSKVKVAETAESLSKSLGASLETTTMDSTSDTQVRGTKTQAGAQVVTTCAQLVSTDTPIMERVNIEHAQVLAVGKLCSLPNKGKGKFGKQGKSKGTTKGKQMTAKGKGKTAEFQEAVSIYLGQEGYIVCVLAFGADVNCLPPLETLPGCFVDFTNAKSRAGQKGVLYFDEQSRLVKRFHEHASTNTPMFEHHLSEASQDMATQDFIQSMKVGDFVSIVLRISTLEESATNNTGEPFLCIYGVDMDGTTMGPIRLWRWTAAEGGMQTGSTVVLRGLRVVAETNWSVDKWAYVPREDGAMTVECNFRTAVEDVSAVEAIVALYD